MSPELRTFLAAEDLDELLDARSNIATLSAEDSEVVRDVIAQWQQPQAVSNLLIHPNLLPEDVRLTCLFRGLAEHRVPYYVLAAIVGFQSIEPNRLTTDENAKIATALWDVIAQTEGVLAQRASLSFRAFASEVEAPAVLFLMAHSDKTVRHNLRSWLFSVFKDRGLEAFANAVQASDLGEAQKQELVAEFTAFTTTPPEGFNSPLFPLLTYIPNLRDTEYPK